MYVCKHACMCIRTAEYIAFDHWNHRGHCGHESQAIALLYARKACIKSQTLKPQSKVEAMGPLALLRDLKGYK